MLERRIRRLEAQATPARKPWCPDSPVLLALAERGLIRWSDEAQTWLMLTDVRTIEDEYFAERRRQGLGRD